MTQTPLQGDNSNLEAEFGHSHRNMNQSLRLKSQDDSQKVQVDTLHEEEKAYSGVGIQNLFSEAELANLDSKHDLEP